MKAKFTSLLIAVAIGTSAIAQPASFAPRGIGGGGSLFFPTINPANDNEFYIACDMSQMFHSTDFGDSYSQIHFSKLSVHNISTYEFTNNSSIAYSNYSDGNDGYPVKTTDGGTTWVKLSGFDANEGMVYAMRANYNNPSQLLMNYYDKIVISNDGGATFQTVKTAANSGVGITLGGAFFDGSNIYIGTNEGIFQSINSGSSFSVMSTTGITGGQVIWSFAAAKNGGITRFACITAASADVYNGLMPWDYYGLYKGVYTMDNANGTWTSKATGINAANDNLMYVGMAWNDINTIYLAGNDDALGAALIYKSVNGGNSWNKVFKTANNDNIKTGWSGKGGDKSWGWGESVFGIAVAPNNSNKVLFGDYGFVHVTSDGGDNWKQAYVNNADQHAANAATPTKQTYHSIGLENTTCWQIDWQSANSMMAAYSDIGAIRSADSGRSWGFTYTGMSVNSVYRIAKTPGGNMFAATSGIHDMYQSTRLKDAQLDAADANGKIMYSTNRGASWSQLKSFGHPVFWLAIDPNDSNKMYASLIHYGGGSGQGGIWMTSDLNNLAGSTWTKLANPPRTEGHPASIVVLNDGKVLCTYSGRINGGGSFTASSGVFLYDPVTNSWSDKSDAGMQYWTKDIVLDPSDATQSTWYACVFSGWGGAPNGKGGLYKTTNRGTSWTKLTGTALDRVTSITFNPKKNNEAYLTTETQGLYFSTEMNTPTTGWKLVDAYPFRQPERVFYNPYNDDEVWVTSFGNGMRVSSSVTNPVVINMLSGHSSRLLIYPNPATDILNVDIPADNGSIEKCVMIYNNQGQLISSTKAANSSVLQININNLMPGVYVVKCGDSSALFVKE